MLHFQIETLRQLDLGPASAGSTASETGESTRRSIAWPIPELPNQDIGVWEASPGTFRRAVTSGEYMHILGGHADFVFDDGRTITLKSGDTVVFPAHTQGIWHVHQALRKIYVLL
jgi:uncharacterized cupin superfamily protein